jgi:hypothetical protein
MIRWLLILSLVLQGLSTQPRCTAADSGQPECIVTTCIAPPLPVETCCAAACCDVGTPAPAPCPQPQDAPCNGPCDCCCNWIACCLFDPDTALTGSGRGGSAETLKTLVLAALPASAPSYPILTDLPVATARPLPQAERIPALACPPRSITNVWTI